MSTVDTYIAEAQAANTQINNTLQGVFNTLNGIAENITPVLPPALALYDYNLGLAAQNSAAALQNLVDSIEKDFPVVPDAEITQFVNALGQAPDPNTLNGIDQPIINAMAAPIPTIPGEDPAVPTVNIPSSPSVQSLTAPAIVDIPPTLSMPAQAPLDLPSIALMPIILPEDMTPNSMPQLEQYVTQLEEFAINTPPLPVQYTDKTYTGTAVDFAQTAVDSLLSGMINGNYGLDDRVGTIIDSQVWVKNSEREEATGQARIQEIERTYAGKGYVLPPGAMLKALEATNDAIMRARNSASREAAVKRADIVVEGYKFTVAQIREYSQMIRQFFNAAAERALQSQMIQLNAVVQIFNTQLGMYNIELQRYRTQVETYNSVIRSIAEQANIYRIRLDASRIMNEENRQLVEIYATQMNAEFRKIDIYRSELEAQGLLLQQARLKSEVDRTRLEAYSEQIRAQMASVDLFKAQVEGEEAKVNVYRQEVEARRAQIDGYVELVNAKVATIRSAAEVVNAQTSTFSTRVQAYAAGAVAVTDMAGVEVKRFEAGVEQVKAKVAMSADVAQINVALSNTAASVYEASVQQVTAQNQLLLQQNTNTTTLRLNATKQLMDYAQAVSAALSSSTVALGISTS